MRKRAGKGGQRSSDDYFAAIRRYLARDPIRGSLARKPARLSRWELSAKLNRSRSYISKIEGGERRVEVCEFPEVSDAIVDDAQALTGRVLEG